MEVSYSIIKEEIWRSGFSVFEEFVVGLKLLCEIFPHFKRVLLVQVRDHATVVLNSQMVVDLEICDVLISEVVYLDQKFPCLSGVDFAELHGLLVTQLDRRDLSESLDELLVHH